MSPAKREGRVGVVLAGQQCDLAGQAAGEAGVGQEPGGFLSEFHFPMCYLEFFERLDTVYFSLVL